jgi:hypothetical protein
VEEDFVLLEVSRKGRHQHSTVCVETRERRGERRKDRGKRSGVEWKAVDSLEEAYGTMEKLQ